jgi:hypothetical protein
MLDLQRGKFMARRIALLLVVSSMVLGCVDSAGPEDKVKGEWHLRTVNGSTLPFILSNTPPVTIEILDGVITLGESGRFAEVGSFRITDGGRISSDTDNAEGIFTVEGSTVTLTYTDGSIYKAVVSGNTMTLVDSDWDPDLTFFYIRE